MSIYKGQLLPALNLHTGKGKQNSDQDPVGRYYANLFCFCSGKGHGLPQDLFRSIRRVRICFQRHGFSVIRAPDEHAGLLLIPFRIDHGIKPFQFSPSPGTDIRKRPDIDRQSSNCVISEIHPYRLNAVPAPDCSFALRGHAMIFAQTRSRISGR